MSYFAIQVRSGQEIKAKEMLKHVLINTGNTLVKGVHALETFTEMINDSKEDVHIDPSLNENDIISHLELERMRSGLSNLRQQYESIKRYYSPKYMALKKEYREKMNILIRQIKQLRKHSKEMYSVMSGYLIVQLNLNSLYLPDQLWHLIKSIPLVTNVVSKWNIPQEEMEQFFNKLEIEVSPDVEVQLNKEMDLDTIDEIEDELLHKANKKETSANKQVEIFDKLDDLYINAVDRVKEIIHNKKANSMLSKVRAFIKRKYETINLPLSLLKQLYTQIELQNIGKIISSKDFLYRLEILAEREMLLE